MARRRLANLWAVALCLAGNAWGADSAAGPAGSGAQFFASSDGASVAAPFGARRHGRPGLERPDGGPRKPANRP